MAKVRVVPVLLVLVGFMPAPDGRRDPPRHTELTESRPAADSVLDGPVEGILLTFSTPVQLPLSRVTVTGPDGGQVPAGRLVHATDRPDRLHLPLPEPLAVGLHRVEWRTGSPDGHIVSGEFRFTVRTTSAPTGGVQAGGDPVLPPPEAEAAEPEAEAAEARPLVPPGTGARWLHLLGTVLLVGVAGFRTGVLLPLRRRGEMAPVVDAAEGGLQGLAWAGALLLLFTLPIRLLRQMDAVGSGLLDEPTTFLLFQTAWGASWFFHLAATLVALVGLVLMRSEGSGRRGWAILVGAAVLLPLVHALSGHPWGSGARALAAPAMYVHVSAVGVWLGGLIALLAAGLPAVRRGSGSAAPEGGGVLPPIARLVNAFSRIALVAVTVLVLSGALSAYIQLGGLGNLITTGYGRVLMVKLAVAGGAFALGFYNWKKARPGLAERPDPGLLRIPAAVEASLGVLVLVATAVLSATPPPPLP